MDRAIKGLAWYTVVLFIFVVVNMTTSIGQAMTINLLICMVNIIVFIPVVALGILVLIRIKRRD